MRIGEEVFAVYPRRKWRNTLDNEENGPEGRSRRRPNDVMRVLAKRAVRVPGTVLVEVHHLDGGAEDEQNCEERNEQNANLGS